MEDLVKSLKVISSAWGKQKGYCFFPWIKGDVTEKYERILGYKEGPAFRWDDTEASRTKILEHLDAHRQDDLYWCPALFEYPARNADLALPERCLWADLDEIDPRSITDYPPTIAWETSPKRYQALWLFRGGRGKRGTSWQGNENQKLTYHLGADQGGWDTTQLLRIPGWSNYKPEYREKYGKAPRGKLLWGNGPDSPKYDPTDFDDLPEIPQVAQYEEAWEDEVDNIDHKEVWKEVRLKVSREVRQLVEQRRIPEIGNRSDKLWQIERDLADAGCTAAEIIAVAQETVWNKHAGRQDEFRRLASEAAKAIAQRPEDKKAAIKEEREGFPDPVNLFELIEHVEPPNWLVKGLWTVGACGFVAGVPKSFKSLVALDIVLSIASGGRALDRFEVPKPGPVLYVQEEDAPATLAQRVPKIYEGKKSAQVVGVDGDEILWDMPKKPEVNAVVRASLDLSDDLTQEWLDEQLAKGYNGTPYVMLVLDPLINLIADVDLNNSSSIRPKVLNPLDQLSNKHDVAILIVHHNMKAGANSNPRAGQRLLGSTALHGWAANSIYITGFNKGAVEVETESKHALPTKFSIYGILNSEVWEPRVTRVLGLYDDIAPEPSKTTKSRIRRSANRLTPVQEALKKLKIAYTHQIAEASGRDTDTTRKQLKRGLNKFCTQEGNKWIWNGG